MSTATQAKLAETAAPAETLPPGHPFYGIEEIIAGVQARHNAKRAAETAWYAAQRKDSGQHTADELRAQLVQVSIGHDPAYMQSEDHTFFYAQAHQAAQIAALKRDIDAAELVERLTS